MTWIIYDDPADGPYWKFLPAVGSDGVRLQNRVPIQKPDEFAAAIMAAYPKVRLAMREDFESADPWIETPDELRVAPESSAADSADSDKKPRKQRA